MAFKAHFRVFLSLVNPITSFKCDKTYTTSSAHTYYILPHSKQLGTPKNTRSIHDFQVRNSELWKEARIPSWNSKLCDRSNRFFPARSNLFLEFPFFFRTLGSRTFPTSHWNAAYHLENETNRKRPVPI